MKGINKFLAVVFAIVIVISCISLILFVGDIIKIQNITNLLDMLTETRESRIATVIVSAIVGVLAIIFGITTESIDGNYGGSLTLPLDTGNISISAQTFEAIVINVAKKYNSLKNVKTRVDIREEGLYVDLFVYVLAGTVVSDVMCKVQEDIKNTILKQTTVEVKTVEVKVRGIYSQSDNSMQD